MAQQGYIGRNPGDGRTIVNRQTSHVTTGLQTSFTMTAGYEIGYLDVYLNGIKQTETLDYTASDGSTINFGLSFPPVNGDVLEFVAFETLNITNIKSARRNFNVGQDLTVDGNVTIGSSLTVASDLVVNGTFTTINTEILDVEDKTVGIASTSSPSNTTADGAGIVIYGGSDGDKSLTWNSTKSNFVLVGGGVSIGTGVTISTPAANVLAFSVNSAEKARFNNFGAFTVGYEGEAWHESTYVGVLQAGSGAWIGQTPGASARAEWVNNAYYDSVNTRWEYIAADEANRIVLENGELKVQSADAGSADGAITWNEKLKMTVGGDFKIGAPTGIGITISSSGNVDSIGIVTATTFVGAFTGTASGNTTISNNADNRVITGGSGNALNGDFLVASGPHGLSRLGLALLLNDPLTKNNEITDLLKSKAIQTHQRPIPPLKALQALLKCKPKDLPWRAAGTDSSDGLLEALQNLCNSSNCQAIINPKNLPKDKNWPIGPQWDSWCLNGGEDFELILSLPPSWAQSLIKTLPSSQIIGIMKSGSPKIIWKDGKEIEKNHLLEFKHF